MHYLNYCFFLSFPLTLLSLRKSTASKMRGDSSFNSISIIIKFKSILGVENRVGTLPLPMLNVGSSFPLHFSVLFFPSPPTCLAPPPGQNLASHPPPDDAEQQAALLLACSGDTSPAALPRVNMYDLFEALQVTSLFC